MPILSNVEGKIERVERFKTAFFKNGSNVKGNKMDIPQYPYEKAAPGDWTVSEWKSKRFNACYPGYEVKVYQDNGMEAPGNMKLSTVRGEN